MESKKFLITTILMLSLCSCSINKNEFTTKILFDNIIVLSDVTNRIVLEDYKKPVHDTVIISRLLDFYHDQIVRPGKTINPQHIFQFYNINSLKISNCNSINKIDLSSFKNSTEKSSYINSRVPGSSLKDDIYKLKNRISCEYQNTDAGGDILNSLNLILKVNENIKKTDLILDSANDVTKQWRNTIVVFTDGYLEFKGMKKSHYSTHNKIYQIRTLCQSKKISIENVLESNPNLKLEKLNNPAFGESRLFILETFDRSIDRKNGTSNESISDESILRILWSTWAKESGFEEFDYFPYFKNTDEINSRLSNLFKSH